MTLGLGMIARNREWEIVDRALASIKGSVDHIYLTVADKEEPKDDIKAIAAKYGAEISYFEWINDFSAARNFNMSQCKDDWYVWMDSDDTIEGMEKAKDKLDQLSPNICYVLCTYNYAFTPTGKVATQHPKERFIRMGGDHAWKGRLHETCVASYQTDGIKWEDIVWNHHSTEERHLESSKRNCEIIEGEMTEQTKSNSVDPRTVFNLGMAYSSVAQITGEKKDWERALEAFYKYLQLGEWEEHQYMAWKYVGISCVFLERYLDALNAYFMCLKLRPGYADSYSMLGSIYERLNDNDRAEHWFQLALVAGNKNEYADDLTTRVVTPLFSLARIYAMRGKYENALTFIKEAKTFVGEADEAINGMEQEILRIKCFMDEAKSEVARLNALPEGQQQAEFDKLETRLKSHPQLCLYRRSKKWKTSTNGREVVIMTGQAWEEWNPDYVKTGIGGSEEAVINMALQLKSLGWDVTVYGSHGPEAKQYDGIWYKPFWEYSYEEPCDVFIGWRDPGLFDFNINAKKRYLWLHDVTPAESITPKRLKNITKVFVLSNYHRSLYTNVPDQKILLTGNGIDPKHFEVEGITRNPKRILYTSAPDRGLLTLLQMWPKIKERVPDAELHWAYGWNTFDKALSHKPAMQAYKQQVLDLLKQEGVHELGRIGHEELAKLMLSSGVWAYPTQFTEIYCITAVKMQAAGCMPVTTTVAALDEMVRYGWKFDAQDIYTNVAAQERFIDAVVSATSTEEGQRKDMMQWGRTEKTWEATAKQWDNEFNA